MAAEGGAEDGAKHGAKHGADRAGPPPAAGGALDRPFGALAPEAATLIAPGLWVFPTPLPFPPKAVNAVILEDGPGLTVIDPGLWMAQTSAAWAALLETAFPGRPITRIVATHFHPDHLGQAGALMADAPAAREASFWATRTSYLSARMLQLDAWTDPPEPARRFHVRAGCDAEMLARWEARARMNFSVSTAPLPLGYRRIVEGETLRIGARDWRVLIGDGHAPEHALLLCEAEGLLIAGDQILPDVTPTLSVYPTEPDADPVGAWIESCAALSAQVDDQLLTIPGHGAPFRGARRRLQRMRASTLATQERVLALLSEPRRTVDCFAALYRRPVTPPIEGLAIYGATAHLNRLRAEGRAVRALDADGAWRWRAA